MREVRLIGLADAKPIIETYHYSHKVPTGKNIFFGWFVDDELYAVADYGIGVNVYQSSFLSRRTGLPVSNINLVELKRLARIEPKRDELPLTSFLAGCHKLLAQFGYEFVVSFSDPAHGHTGGIYKAANFVYLGQTFREWHVQDAEGIIRHRRYPYRFARRNGCTIGEAREQLGLTRVLMPAKDRWFLAISPRHRKAQNRLRSEN